VQNPLIQKTQPQQFKVRWFDEIDSTNTRLLEQVLRDPALPSGTILAARRQTAGRGRLERKWVSCVNGNLLFSLYYRTSAGVCQLPSLSMAMAIAIDEMLHGFHVASNLKWPNDIQVHGCKMAGLLAERAGDEGVVLGVGLNVNMTAVEVSQIDQPATSLSLESGTEWDVEKVLKILLTTYLPPWLERWEASGFAGLRERWIQGCGGLGAILVVREEARRISGFLAGFGENGELLLRLPEGVIQTFWAGEVGAP